MGEERGACICLDKKNKNALRNWFGVLLLAVMLFVPFFAPVNNYLSIPNEIVTFDNPSASELPAINESVEVHATNDNVDIVNSSTFFTNESGTSQVVYEFAGMPIKKVNLSVLDDLKIVPGGQSLGVQLQTNGVLVVGHHLVNGTDSSSPGEKADIQVGDSILAINGTQIEDMEDVQPLVNKAGENGETLDVAIKREKETMETTLEPMLDEKDNKYKIGLYIRDSAAGIGTMTFYHPDSKKYGALGHVISDMDTQKPIQINDGAIVGSNVKSIHKGNNGVPGEKQAEFSMDEDQLGTITKNSPFGIFGNLENEVNSHEDYSEPMPIALSHEVEEGPAKILTVVEGEKVEEFEVEVISSVPQKFPATKGMVVQITDSELLEKTGGIVQGMSGSPIIQNGKIIGAVTHVFVNDPTSGYGVHIEWMLQEAGIDVYEEKQEAS